MVGNMLEGFEEFKNTKASRKASNETEYVITVRLVKSYKNGKAVNLTFSKDLVRDLKKKGITTFKLLYNEKENAIGLRYDASSNCIDLKNYKIPANGVLAIRDKYITYTFVPVLEKDNLDGYKFAGKYFQMGSCYIFRVVQKFKP